MPRQHRRLVLQGHVDRIDHQDLRRLARVVGPAGHAQVDQVGRPDAQPCAGGGG